MSRQFTRRETLTAMSAGAAAWLAGEHPVAASPTESALTGPTESSWASFRNGPAQRGIAKTTLAAKPELKWEVVSRDGWMATCAIVGDHVYAPALQGYLHCFDRATGTELWRYRTIESTDEKKFAPGFKAAPLVTAKAVYVGDEDGILHAVDRVSGRGLWKYATDAEIAGGVAAYQDKLLLASHDAFLYCHNSAGGSLRTKEGSPNKLFNLLGEYPIRLSGSGTLIRTSGSGSGTGSGTIADGCTAATSIAASCEGSTGIID